MLGKIIIDNRLFTAFSLVLIIMIMLGLGALKSIDIVANTSIDILADTTSKMYRHPLTVSNAVRDANVHIVAMHRSMKDVVLANNEEEIEAAIAQVEQHEKEVLHYFQIVQERFLGDEILVTTTLQSIRDWRQIRNEVISLVRTGQYSVAEIITKGKGAKHMALIEKKMGVLTAFASNKALEYKVNAEKKHKQILLEHKQSLLLMGILLLLVYLGNIAITIAVTRNIKKEISERKQAEEALRESEKKYRGLVETAPDGMVIVNAKGEITIINQQLQKMTGYTVDDLIGQPVEMLIPGRFKTHKRQREGYLLDPRVRPMGEGAELSVRCKDGSEFPTEISLSPFATVDGLCVTAAIRDITERKMAQEVIERFSRIFEDSLNEIYLFDTNTLKLVQVNTAAQHNLGYTMEELQELAPFDLKPEFTAEAFAELIAPLRKGEKEKIVFETVHQRKDKSLYDVEIHLQLLKHEHKALFVGIILDITERKRTQDALINIAKGVSSSTGELFFPSMVKHLTLALQADIAIIGQLVEDDSRHIRTIACIADGELLENFEYDLEHTPCATAVDQSLCVHPRGVQQLYPQDLMLKEMDVEAYVGVCLYDSTGNIYGIMSVLYHKAVNNLKSAESMLKIFAVRASAEMERLQIESELKASEEFFSKSFHSNPEPMAISTITEGRFVDINDSFVQSCGYSREELIGHTLTELNMWVDKNQRDILVHDLEYGVVHKMDIDIRTHSGEIRNYQTSAEIIEVNNQLHLLAISRDVTEQNRTQRALKVLSQCNHAMIHATDEKKLLDEICRIIVDTGGYRFAWVGYPQQDISKSVKPMAHEGLELGYLDNLISWSGGIRGRGPVGTTMRTGEHSIIKNIATDNIFEPWRKEALNRGYASMIALPLKINNEMIGVVAIYTGEVISFDEDEVDLLIKLADNLAYGIQALNTQAERKQAQVEIKQSQEQLRDLANQLQVVREEERTKISREIHDQLGQNLSFLKIDLSWMLEHLPPAPELRDLKERARNDLMLMDETLQTVRRISHDLRPAMLDELGLEAAIEHQVEVFNQRTGKGCLCELELNAKDIELDNVRDTVVFRVLQESLTNVVRHANADRVKVALSTLDSQLVLSVEDNGIGIDKKEKTSNKYSIGIIGMSERCKSIGGTFQIEATNEGGTRIICSVPLSVAA